MGFSVTSLRTKKNIGSVCTCNIGPQRESFENGNMPSACTDTEFDLVFQSKPSS
jgi:hypothetical protein